MRLTRRTPSGCNRAKNEALSLSTGPLGFDHCPGWLDPRASQQLGFARCIHVQGLPPLNSASIVEK